jgi:hypothetical protein
MKCPKCKTPNLEVENKAGILIRYTDKKKPYYKAKCSMCGYFDIEKDKFMREARKQKLI